jgi:hypothetical protein
MSVILIRDAFGGEVVRVRQIVGGIQTVCWGDYQQNSRISVNRQEHIRDSFSKPSREGNINLCFIRCANSNRNILYLQEGYLVDEVIESLHCR